MQERVAKKGMKAKYSLLLEEFHKKKKTSVCILKLLQEMF